eukprot:945131-Alexandrium_andersonii.AAC.1
MSPRHAKESRSPAPQSRCQGAMLAGACPSRTLHRCRGKRTRAELLRGSPPTARMAPPKQPVPFFDGTRAP